MSSVEDHRRSSPLRVACAVLTISDTRTMETDTSGSAIMDLLEEEGHMVAARALVPDDAGQIRAAIDELLARADVQVVLTTGGTGITRRDSTYEVVSGLIDKPLDGFGELFRMLSYTEVGPAAMLSRACGGVVRGRLLFALPGSEAAVRLAMVKLLLPELGHLVRETSR